MSEQIRNGNWFAIIYGELNEKRSLYQNNKTKYLFLVYILCFIQYNTDLLRFKIFELIEEDFGSTSDPSEQ